MGKFKGGYMSSLLVYTIASFLITACGKSGGSDASPTETAPSNPISVIPSDPSTPASVPTPAPTVQSVELTEYTMSRTVVLTNRQTYTTATMTGHCVQYDSNDYCWDDGYQVVALDSNSAVDFWGLWTANGRDATFLGELSVTITPIDPVAATPTLWAQQAIVVAYQNQTPPETPSSVYAGGQPNQLTCVVSGTQLNCGDFVIDLNQAAL